MELRPYQIECVDAVMKAKAHGRKRVLYVLPTGCGKTQVFCTLAERILQQDRRPVLVIAHREELLSQAAERVKLMVPGLRVGTERAGQTCPSVAHVVVASVQTIGRKTSNRLQWLADKAPSAIIIDEAHHSTATGYQNVIERFGGYDDRTFVVGCTATPKRLDRKALHGIHGATFEEEVYRYEIRKAIKDGFLCPVRGFRVVSDVDMSKVGNVAGDFNLGQLAAAVNVSARTKKAVAHWVEVAGDRKTIAFCVNVEHAQNAAEAFRLVGATAECIHGALKPDERKAILARLKSGETQVVTNCEVLTEGFDQPDVSSVVMLRPTQSWSMYVQMVGRGTRLAPGKKDLIVIDVVDNCQKHSLATVPAIIDLPPGLDLQGHTLEEAADALDELGAGAAVLQKAEPKDFDELKTMLRTVDLFGQVDPPAEVVNSSDLNWLAVPGGYYISAGGNRSARITQDALENYHLQLYAEDERHDPILLGEEAGPSLRAADNALLTAWPDSMNIVRRAARWRKEPPTPKQVETLMKFRIAPAAIAAMTKGQASSMIGQCIQQRQARH